MNKGFSLVELIVVIAIMAILVGVAVPVYTSYITKANENVDKQYADELERAVDTLIIDIKAGVTDAYKNYYIPASITWNTPSEGTKYVTCVYNENVTDNGFEAALNKLIALDVKPKASTTNVTIDVPTVDETPAAAASAGGNAGTGEVTTPDGEG